MRINHGLLFWGVALVTAGAVALAVQAGVLSRDLIGQAWRFWPVVLIGAGLAVVAARTPLAPIGTLVAALMAGALGGSLVAGAPGGFGIGCGGTPDEQLADSGTFSGDSAEVELDLPCGMLEVTAASGTGWRVDARHAGGPQPELSAGNDSLSLRSGGGFFFTASRQEWVVTLPADVTLDMTVDANAGSSSLDLAEARLGDVNLDMNAGDLSADLSGAEAASLSIDANAGSVTLLVSEASRVTGSVSVNAGSVNLCAPQDARLAITVGEDNITFSHNLDGSGLVQQGNTWRSEGAGAAAVTISLSGNAASFSLSPTEECQ